MSVHSSMSSLADAPDLVGFFSYSREDDEGSGGKLSRLRERIQEELRLQLGRSWKDFRLWQDKAAIAHGELWEDTIKKGISESVFFIPIITPTAVKSPNCKFEFQSFLARERELDRNNLIFPILYVPVPALRDERWHQDPLLSIIGSRQYEEWQNLRHLDASSTEVAQRVEKFCANICRALQQEWLSPEERQQAEARQREEDERRRQEAENKRRLEEAEAGERRRAEEERRRQEELQQAEARQREEDERRRQEAENKRRLEEAEAEKRRQAERRRQEAEIKRRAEAEKRRQAERRQQEAESKRRSDEAEAEERRRAESVAALVSRGLDYYNKNDPDQAIADYDEAIRLDPDALAFNHRGIAYYNKKDYDQAIADYDEAIRLN